jgi:hypothetical protein
LKTIPVSQAERKTFMRITSVQEALALPRGRLIALETPWQVAPFTAEDVTKVAKNLITNGDTRHFFSQAALVAYGRDGDFQIISRKFRAYSPNPKGLPSKLKTTLHDAEDALCLKRGRLGQLDDHGELTIRFSIEDVAWAADKIIGSEHAAHVFTTQADVVRFA